MNFIKTNILKAIAILLFSFAVTNITKAQVAIGTIRFGTEIGFSFVSQQNGTSSVNDASSTLDLQLAGGIFLINNLELSLAIQATRSKSKYVTTDFSSKGFYYGSGLTYMIPLSENLYLPISGSFGYYMTTLEGVFYEERKGLKYGAGIGIEYIISNKIGFRFSMLYDHKSLKEYFGEDITISTIQTGIGINIYF